ncbi:hypothetical protein BKA93DRAFT_822747 [Sparassis latifolia]
MSTVLETIPIIPSFQNSTSVDALGRSSESYVHLELPVEHPEKSEVVSQLEHQLLQLASQHHASEYNRLKYGPRGSPMTYVPLSIMMPDQVKELQEHQARCAEQRAWWPCEKRATSQISNHSFDDDHEERPRSRNPRLSRSTSSTDLRQELSAAMSSPLVLPLSPPVFPQVQSLPQMKTSESHPINVSAIIPVELLRIVSAHLVEPEQPSAVMFEVPPVYYLNRSIMRTSSASPHPRPTAPSTPLGGMRSFTAPACSPAYGLVRPTKLSHFFWSNPTVRRAFHSALGTSMKSPHVKRMRPKPMMTSDSPFGDSLSEGTSSEGCDADPPDMPAATIVSFHECEKQETPHFVRPTSAPPEIDGGADSKACTCNNPVVDFHTVSSTFYTPVESIDSPSRPGTPAVPMCQPGMCYPTMLGNLYLSSCPGKKVRLDGPTKGRIGVCRDLRKDLMRMKELGVACIICCLDDDELGFLGVSWAEYVHLADELGIDMLRLPTPEGLAPPDPAVLDEHLTYLIKKFTLRGSPILIHCRGGVGRAGLLACCWILKLGLCGWIETEPRLSGAREDAYQSLLSDSGASMTEPVRRDTLQLVERLITVVRRRRSPKAIETYEQVKFLADFVEFLRKRTASATVLDSFVPDWDLQID